MKIAIIGYSGSGKSTLASLFAKKYDLSLLYLDTAHFLPDWVIRPAEERAAIVEKFLNENENWVIDGTYSKVFYERRLSEADEIIFMNFNRVACFFRAWKRYRTYRGQVRESIAEGCREKFDRAFAKWILYKSRTKESRARYRRVLTEYADKVTVIKNQRELSRFVQERGLSL